MIKEIWKDITGYEGLYQVSNLGNVKRLGNSKTKKEALLKPGRTRKGYLMVSLSKKNVQKNFYIHRLVANAFIPNPNNLPEVNHKDECKTNNCSENLQWCNTKYNINYGTARKRIVNSMINHPKISKPIKCLDLETKEIIYYPSIREVARQMDINYSSIYNYVHSSKSPYLNRFIFSVIN